MAKCTIDGSYSSSYLSQLDELVPKTHEACQKINSNEKADRLGKITHILAQVFQNLSCFDKTQRPNIINICDLAKNAETMQLLSEPAKGILSEIVASPHLKDLRIITRDGETQVNSDILKKNSEVFKGMLGSGMREGIKMAVELKDYSTGTIEFLMSYLYASSSAELILPHNNSMVLELIDLSLKYCFNDFILKLEPVVAQFIQNNPRLFVDIASAEKWVDLLLPHAHKGTQNHSVNMWIENITLHLMQSFDIPVTPSKISGGYNIPVGYAASFFDEGTKDILQHLPVSLDIKGEKDMMAFQEMCDAFGSKEPLQIGLACSYLIKPEEEISIRNFAKARNIEVILEKLPIPPDAAVFGKEQWEMYYGLVGEAPPLPHDIVEILMGPCPFNPGKMVKDTHMLVLIPATVNGKPLDLNTFGELVQHPRAGHSTKYDFVYDQILHEHGSKGTPEGSHWVLMTKDVIPGSREITYARQQARVMAKPNYEVPDVLSAAVCICTHFVHTGTRLFPKEPWTFTHCKDIAGGFPTLVGGFDEAGICLSYILGNSGCSFHERIGVAGLRKIS